MDKAVLFDFGGTLDTNGVHWSVKFLEIYKELGLQFSPEQYNYAYVKADEELKQRVNVINDYETLLRKQVKLQLEFMKPYGYDSEKKLDELGETVLNKIMIDIIPCIEESRNILAILKKQYRLGVVSNFYGNLEKICKNIGFTKYLDVMIDSEIVGIEKPHPGIFSIALERLGVKPENTFVIGDSYERDIIPSKILGCKTIWLKNKSFKESNNADSADYTVNNLGVILRYLT